MVELTSYELGDGLLAGVEEGYELTEDTLTVSYVDGEGVAVGIEYHVGTDGYETVLVDTSADVDEVGTVDVGGTEELNTDTEVCVYVIGQIEVDTTTTSVVV